MIDSGLSGKQLNRAGKVLREVSRALTAGKNLDGFDAARLSATIETVDLWRSLHARPLAKVNVGLRYYVKKVGAEAEVSQRLKRFETIMHKLEREPTMALSRMEDIGGVRVILPTQQQVLSVCEMLDKADRWKIHRRRYYIDGRDPGPKSDGYRAVHLIVVKDGCYIEIQLRTPWQDAWAQSVEQDTRRLRANLKFGSGPDDLRDYYRLVSEYFALREAHIEPGEEVMEDLANRYAATRRYFPSR